MPAYHVLYRQSQGRIQQLIHKGNENTQVEACPGWTVKDTIAHLLGVLADLTAGKIAEANGDDWGESHVLLARARSYADIAGEWHLRANTSPGVFQELGEILLADLVTHEFDIKQAIGNTQGRDEYVVRSVALFYLNALDHAWRAEGTPALRFITEDKSIDIGGDAPASSVTVGWWELMRLVSGRRSPDQVRALTWSTSPDPWINEMYVFGPRETPLVE